MCTGYVTKEGDYYSIDIPSSVGGQEITTLGNNLFNALVGFDEDGIQRLINIKI